MLKRCLKLFPRLDREYDEVKYRNRTLGPLPWKKLDWYRVPQYTENFREFGPEWARVWVHIPGKIRRHRAGRSLDFSDSRYYYRPLGKSSQRKYLRRFRTEYEPFNPDYVIKHLHRTNEEIAALRSGREFDKSGWRKRYGVGDPVAPSPRRDWEFRVN